MKRQERIFNDVELNAEPIFKDDLPVKYDLNMHIEKQKKDKKNIITNILDLFHIIIDFFD